jgi:fused signal recognition particle receptor
VAATAGGEKSGWLARLRAGLAKTGAILNTDVGDLFARHGNIDEALFEELETLLLTADVGVHATNALITSLRRVAREKRLSGADELRAEFQRELNSLLAPLEQALTVPAKRPFVLMVAGVNGAGKTTTIGKLAHHFRAQGLGVLLAAGDTFRAAAREQLQAWGERNGVAVVAQHGGDPAAVMFDAVQAAKARGVDVVIVDTAGRLPTQLHLMEEIKKAKRVIAKAEAGAPHEVLLVIDANTGQNAREQVRIFDAALGVSGLIVTKLDGTAKGGMLAALAMERRTGRGASDGAPIPVRFIGVGEGIDDLKPFVAREFVEALFRPHPSARPADA